MRLEDMENEFPKMPEDMRAMVEREVEKQVKTTSATHYRKGKHMARRSFVAALVAAMALGTTVFAGVMYQMHVRNVGKYAVETKVESAGGSETAGTEMEQSLPEILAVNMELSYLPEGMVETEEGKYCYEDAMYLGGVSICFYRMDTGDDKFEMLTKDVLSSEDLTVGGRDGVYLLLNTLDDGTISFNQRIYVAYTDVHYVMEMYVASDVTKEDAIKIAEGVKLTPVLDGEGDNVVSSWDWSDYLAAFREDEMQNETEEFSDTSVPKAEMSNIHAIGESFSVGDMGLEKSEGLAIKVSDVQVRDDISLLDEAYLDADDKTELQEETDADGKLLPAKINYIKYGDGVDTVDEIVSTREVPQKLVYATVEYTNTGNSKMSEVLFMGGLCKIKEDGDQMKMYFGEQPGEGADWDAAQLTGAAACQEMYYYDVQGGERNNNYITSIEPGETVTVHMAWIVPEEELGYLYLNLDPSGGVYEFSDHALIAGFVDIRQ